MTLKLTIMIPTEMVCNKMSERRETNTYGYQSYLTDDLNDKEVNNLIELIEGGLGNELIGVPLNNGKNVYIRSMYIVSLEEV